MPQIRVVRAERHRHKKQIQPLPETRRFCPVCLKIRNFKYNKMIFHSVCLNCGYHGPDAIKVSVLSNPNNREKLLHYLKTEKRVDDFIKNMRKKNADDEKK